MPERNEDCQGLFLASFGGVGILVRDNTVLGLT